MQVYGHGAPLRDFTYIDDVVDGTADDSRKQPKYHFDRHTPEYRLQFQKITEEMHEKCPMAWTETYNGHWVAAGSKEVFELARCPVVSNHHDISGETPYQGITIPKASRATVVRGGILEMDEPEHSAYRGALNPYLSPAAIKSSQRQEGQDPAQRPRAHGTCLSNSPWLTASLDVAVAAVGAAVGAAAAA